MLFGSLRMMSPNNLACTTTSPASAPSTSNFFSMVKSKSDADMVKIPSSLTLSKIPLRIGMVVLEVTAFETILKAFVSTC